MTLLRILLALSLAVTIGCIPIPIDLPQPPPIDLPQPPTIDPPQPPVDVLIPDIEPAVDPVEVPQPDIEPAVDSTEKSFAPPPHEYWGKQCGSEISLVFPGGVLLVMGLVWGIRTARVYWAAVGARFATARH